MRSQAINAPPPNSPGLFLFLLIPLMMFTFGCANLSAEQNKADAAHAVHVLNTDAQADLPDEPVAQRNAIIDQLQETAGSAKPEAVEAMAGAHGWWKDFRRTDLNEHVVKARERFFNEATETAKQAAAQSN